MDPDTAHGHCAPPAGQAPAAPPTPLSITVRDGGRLWSDRRGGGPGAGVTVVLVHGWCLDSRSWDRVADRLAGPDLRVLRYDLRGHGRSARVPVADASIARLADDLAEVLAAAVPPGPVVLAGHSLGGMALMELAVRYPHLFGTRIRGVALVATSAHTTGTPRGGIARAIRRADLAGHRLLRRCGRWRPQRPLERPVLRPGMRRLAFGTAADRDAVRLAAHMIAGTPALTVGAFRLAIEAHAMLDGLGALATVPVTVLAGTRDRLTPPAAAGAIARALPRARLVVYQGAGHMLPLERPDETAGEIRRLARPQGDALRGTHD